MLVLGRWLKRGDRGDRWDRGVDGGHFHIQKVLAIVAARLKVPGHVQHIVGGVLNVE